ncbi:MAG: ATP-binding protein [Methanomassiliicoccales archaeon]|nr:MAG: ATP-binding protein [Methanomassiliicoccales archaeon]
MKNINKIQTGISGLDKMLDGGLIPERPYIISGPPGAGKTTLGMQFLMEGIRKGERVLFIALQEPVNEIKFNMDSLKLNVANIEILDANSDVRRYEPTPVMEISSKSRVQKIKNVQEYIRKTPRFKSTVVSVHSLQTTLKTEFRNTRYGRIVIDSLTALKYFCMSGEEDILLQSFLRFLSESKMTSLLTVETPENYVLSPEMFLARGEIRLHKFRENSRIMRMISVEKFRGSEHDERAYPMEIKKGEGVVVHGVEEKG